METRDYATEAELNPLSAPRELKLVERHIITMHKWCSCFL